MDIENWRHEIDKIDKELLELLNKRAQFTIEIGKIKQKLALRVYDPERERVIFARLETLNTGPLSNQAVHRLFERIIDESRHLEKEIMLPGNAKTQ